MSKESREFQANVKFDETTYRDLEECSKLDFDRGVAGIIRRIVARHLPELKQELLAERNAASSSAHPKYAVPGRSTLKRGQRGVSKRAEN